MTDIVERLRGGWNHDRNPEADMAEAADCIAKLEQQLIEWKELARNIDAQLRTELAAAQAHNKVLRDGLERLACLGNGDKHGNSTGNTIAIELLSMPTDDTALRAVLRAERERCRLHDAADVATKAMRKAWQLGQTYWQQADSDSYKQNAKSAITQDSFNDLLDSTAEAIRALD